MKLNKFGNFILEKRIAQISTNIEISFGFDIIKTTHSEDRSDFSKRGLGYNSNISNKQIVDFIDLFKTEISEYIANGDIINDTNFVIRSESRNLSMVIIAQEEAPKYWKLIIKTIFPESKFDKLKIGYKQLVFDK